MAKEALAAFLDGNGTEYKSNEPMHRHTTFKIGGAADIFVLPQAEASFVSAVKKCRELDLPYFVIGNGSNLLVSDGGIEGAVISTARLCNIEVNGERLSCGAGAPLSAVCVKACGASLSGLEFAYGIPGSVGGALYMNAGAYGGQMSDVVESALCISRDGELITVKKEDMRAGYRSSCFKSDGLTVLSAVFKLNFGNKAEIEERMQELMNRRREKQPLEFPSAGSTFKRPEGNFAGALIEKNGLKGVAVGGARVSEKHAGFIVNSGGATEKDVSALIEKIQQTVERADGVHLEPEVIFVGRKIK